MQTIPKRDARQTAPFGVTSGTSMFETSHPALKMSFLSVAKADIGRPIQIYGLTP